jgi:hypothetical protein
MKPTMLCLAQPAAARRGMDAAGTPASRVCLLAPVTRLRVVLALCVWACGRGLGVRKCRGWVDAWRVVPCHSRLAQVVGVARGGMYAAGRKHTPVRLHHNLCLYCLSRLGRKVLRCGSLTHGARHLVCPWFGCPCSRVGVVYVACGRGGAITCSPRVVGLCPTQLARTFVACVHTACPPRV